MTQKRETRLVTRVLKRLREIPDSWWEKISQRSIRGTPDVIGCVKGRFVAIEFKTDVGKCDALQQYKLDLIQQAGGLAYVATESNFEKVLERINEHVVTKSTENM